MPAALMYFSSVLVAVYLRPEKTKSGIYYPDKTRDEDRYLGQAALKFAHFKASEREANLPQLNQTQNASSFGKETR